MTSAEEHTVDALARLPDLRLSAVFGPQHGFRGDKQDNMVETDDAFDPHLKIPVFSLYGQVRRPTAAMMGTFDVLLVDLQDIGTRIYTFLTTLRYVLEAAAHHGKSVWILDRPNPVGRPVEGTLLLPGYESFVGAGPLPMRHGLTLGEAAGWFVHHLHLELDWKVVEMQGWDSGEPSGFGWPAGRAWVNPSPNASSLNMARCFPGTVLLEGCTLSEGRGTTVPLEGVWARDLDRDAIVARMRDLAPQWTEGVWIRPSALEPTFHKHQGHLCVGVQFHTDGSSYDHDRFRPYRLVSLFLKAVRLQHPDYPLWRDFPYEYTSGHLAIDVIDGGPLLREWVDAPGASVEDRESRLRQDEVVWEEARRPFLRYP